MILFVGRIQPLKAPDVLLRATASLLHRQPGLRERLVLVINGGPSGSGLARPTALQELAESLGVSDVVRFVPPGPREQVAAWYRAADLTVVPSYSESFGLVAVESQACGTPVLAADVGGLRTAVSDGRSGVLVQGHDPQVWADELATLLGDPARLVRLGRGAVSHASHFSWEATTERLLDVYRGALADSREAALLAALPGRAG